MADFIKLTQITNWKIDKDKKEPTATKTVYVRDYDIVSFEEDDGTTLVELEDKGIHVKETPQEIFEMINGTESKPHVVAPDYNNPYYITYVPWYQPIRKNDWGWWNEFTCHDTSKNIPNYFTTITCYNGEIWE